MANKLNITKGNYIPSSATQSEYACVSLIEDNVLSVHGQHCYSNIDIETSDIAFLCADALNTYQECNLLPSELLQQRNELLESLKEMYSRFEHSEKGFLKADYVRVKAKGLIEKLTQ